MLELAAHWTIDPDVTFLNHGSFGACPRAVLEKQSELRAQLERQPLAFFVRDCEPLLDRAREVLAEFVGADSTDLVFVPNATAGVNSVLRSLRLTAGDELLTTNHVYNACRNALDLVASQSGASVIIAPVPFPIRGPEEVERAVMDRVTDRTRIVLLDHITSPTGLILPAERLIPQLRERGIETLIDGAHAPGMIPLNIRELGPTYYTGNCHKWLCAPKGAAFLYVDPAQQETIRPLSISHGANSPRTDKSRFQLEFDWPGTDDPTPWLCVPTALEFLRGLLPGGFPALREHNRSLVLAGRDLLCQTLNLSQPAPDSMIGSLAAMPIPSLEPGSSCDPLAIDPIQDRLYHDARIEVPIMPSPEPGAKLLRISGAAYNHAAQYERLADALSGILRP